MGDEKFFIDGCLLISNAMICDYLDTTGGNQEIFKNIRIGEVVLKVEGFIPLTEYQQDFKEITLKGLKIAQLIDNYYFENAVPYKNKELDIYYSRLKKCQ